MYWVPTVTNVESSFRQRKRSSEAVYKLSIGKGGLQLPLSWWTSKYLKGTNIKIDLTPCSKSSKLICLWTYCVVCLIKAFSPVALVARMTPNYVFLLFAIPQSSPRLHGRPGTGQAREISSRSQIYSNAHGQKKSDLSLLIDTGSTDVYLNPTDYAPSIYSTAPIFATINPDGAGTETVSVLVYSREGANQIPRSVDRFTKTS
jgi:hypothetical protein